MYRLTHTHRERGGLRPRNIDERREYPEWERRIGRRQVH